MGILLHLIPAESHWQLGRIERHNDVWRYIFEKLVDQHGIADDDAIDDDAPDAIDDEAPKKSSGKKTSGKKTKHAEKDDNDDDGFSFAPWRRVTVAPCCRS